MTHLQGSNRRRRVVNTSWGAIRLGMYARYLDRWLSYFARDQIHFVDGERLISDPGLVMGGVQRFLGLQPLITNRQFVFNEAKGFPCLVRHGRNDTRRRSGVRRDSNPQHLHCLGQNKGRTHPSVDQETLQELRDFYRPHNEKFYRMTGIDFGWN